MPQNVPSNNKKAETQKQPPRPVEIRNGLIDWLQEQLWEPTQGLVEREIAVWEKSLQTLAKQQPEKRDVGMIDSGVRETGALLKRTDILLKAMSTELKVMDVARLVQLANKSGDKSPEAVTACLNATKWTEPDKTLHAMKSLEGTFVEVTSWKQRVDTTYKTFQQLQKNATAQIQPPKPVAKGAANVACRKLNGARPEPYDFGHPPKDAMTIAPKFQQDWANYLADHPAVQSSTRDITQTFQKNKHAKPWLMEFILIPPGEFEMEWNNKKITHPFLLGTYQVTREQWSAALGTEPWNKSWSGKNLPVETVSWLMCVEFCNRLSEIQGLTPAYSGSHPDVKIDPKADGYRLPTDAEWEYTCRGGTPTTWWCGESEEELKKIAWYQTNSNAKTHPVDEKKQPNPFGLVGMHGNVWEWCQEEYDGDKSRRVFRGGAWDHGASNLASAYRGNSTVDSMYDGFGCRIARTVILDS